MKNFNRELFFPGISLVFNIASMFAISDFLSSVTSGFGTASFNQILEGMPQLLKAFVLILGPWILAIILSTSKERVISIRFFSIITIITCVMIVGFKHTGPSEGVGYKIAVQIVIAWVTLGICALIKTKSDAEKI